MNVCLQMRQAIAVIASADLPSVLSFFLEASFSKHAKPLVVRVISPMKRKVIVENS